MFLYDKRPIDLEIDTGDTPQLSKDSVQYAHTQHYSKRRKTQRISIKTKNKTSIPLSPLLSCSISEVLVRAKRQAKKQRGHK